MPLIPSGVGIADRPHVPPLGHPHLDRFKEWYHFSFLDDATGIDFIANFSFSGDLYRPDRGEASLVMLVHDPARGWHGGIDQYDGVAAVIATSGVDIRLGEASLRYDGRRYRIEAALNDGSIRVALAFVPRCEPLMIWKNSRLGSGHINWLILPSLEVTGVVEAGGHAVRIATTCGYHDHNWGFWRWGEDFGWDWGYCPAVETPGGLLSLVYDRAVDRAASRIMDHSLPIWRGEGLVKVFHREMMISERGGSFAGRVDRVPGAANLVNHSALTIVPKVLECIARDGEDRLELRFTPDAAIQIAVPKETGPGLVQLNETLGLLEVVGRLAGEPVAFRRRACFEFVG